jgi:PAS domain S-box-containing protein
MPSGTPSSDRRLADIGRAAIDSGFLGVIRWDSDGRFVEVSQALAELLGYAPADLCRLTWSDITPQRYRSLDERAAEQLRGQGRFVPYEKHLLRSDATETSVLVGGAALGEGGIGFVLDLSERQAGEDALRLSEEHFRALARNVPGVVYLCEHDRWRPFRFVNEAIEQLTGIASRRFCDGRAVFRELIHTDDAPRVAQEIQAAVRRRRPFHVLYRLRNKSGSWRWVEEHGQGVRVEGELRFIQGVILDVTSRVEAEEALHVVNDQLRASRDELEERVRQRTEKQQQANQRLRRERLFLRRTLDQQERHRQLVAYEIHDGLAQYIAAALMQIEAFEGMRSSECGMRNEEERAPAAPRSRASAHGASARGQNAPAPSDANTSFRIPKSAFRNLEAGLELLRKSLDEARRLISGLRPPILDEKGLVAAIDYLISEQPPLPQGIVFTHDVQFERLPPIWESNLFRIVQEALRNVTRHGRARTARIDLWQKGESLRLSVIDDGQGFDRKKLPDRTHGLQGIRQRARLLGGKAAIRSSPGGGTRISVTLPLPRNE